MQDSDRLFEEINSLPETPGVYLMEDSLHNIIYIGKSKNIRKRVKQYFYHSKHHLPKILELVNHIQKVSHFSTETELEALLLECQLIKKHKPRYNSLLKNPQGYAYLKITTNQAFPTIKIVFHKLDDNATYFGPFTNPHTLEKAVTYLFRRFPLKRCNIIGGTKTDSGCLNLYLGHCLGACTKAIDQQLYWKHVKSLIELLECKNKNYLQKLKAEMAQAVDQLDFEKAATLRDEISLMKYLLANQQVISSSKKSSPIIVIEQIKENLYKAFLIKGNRLLGQYSFSDLHSFQDLQRLLTKFILENFSKSSSINYLEKSNLDQAHIINSYLKQRKKYLLQKKISTSWLKEKNYSKLHSQIEKFVFSFFEKFLSKNQIVKPPSRSSSITS